MSEPIGDLLDSLGVTHDPFDGEMVCAAVVLLKIIDEVGGVFLRSTCSDGISWIERVGMLRAAEADEISSLRTKDDE